jgi:hypothetical protein
MQTVAICSLLDEFHGAAANGDFDKYFNCLLPEGRFLGTDKTENWTVAAFKEFSRPYFGLGKPAWIYNPIPGFVFTNVFRFFFIFSRKSGTRVIDVFPSQEAPVFATFDEHLVAKSFETTARGTGTLVFSQSENRWLIAHYYLSFPVPNDLAKDICKKIGIFERIQTNAGREWDDTATHAESRPASAASTTGEEVNISSTAAGSNSRKKKSGGKKKK